MVLPEAKNDAISRLSILRPADVFKDAYLVRISNPDSARHLAEEKAFGDLLTALGAAAAITDVDLLDAWTGELEKMAVPQTIWPGFLGERTSSFINRLVRRSKGITGRLPRP